MTAITINVPSRDLSFFKKMVTKMGWTYEEDAETKPHLYDPETGEYLNNETMKTIEDARNGKDVIKVGSMEDYLKLVNNL